MIAIGVAALVIAAPGLIQFVGLPGLFGGAILALSLTDLPEGGWPHAVAARLGDWSYGIYLWHFPIQLTLIVLLVPNFDLSELASKGWFLGLYFSLVLWWRIFRSGILKPPGERACGAGAKPGRRVSAAWAGP